MQVRRLDTFVFFRIRSNGAIAPGDHLLPGLNTARSNIQERLRHLQHDVDSSRSPPLQDAISISSQDASTFNGTLRGSLYGAYTVQ